MILPNRGLRATFYCAVLAFAAFLAYSLVVFNWSPYNFGVVEKGRIFRSKQPDEQFLQKMVSEYGIKTIIVLRSGIPEFERRIAEENKIEICYLPIRPWQSPTEEQIKTFLETVSDPEKQPVLVHCEAGADRTGVMAAIYRIEINNWTLEKAEKEMWRYRNIFPNYRHFLEERYRK